MSDVKASSKYGAALIVTDAPVVTASFYAGVPDSPLHEELHSRVLHPSSEFLHSLGVILEAAHQYETHIRRGVAESTSKQWRDEWLYEADLIRKHILEVEAVIGDPDAFNGEDSVA